MQDNKIEVTAARVNYYKGISWFILSLVVSVLNDTISKYLGNRLHSLEVSFFRFLFSTITLIPFIIYYGRKSLTTSRPLLHIARGVLLFAGITLWIFGLNIVPISVVTLLSFTIPLFVLILALFFLKENVGWQRWLATIIGFLGIILVLNPGHVNFKPASLLLLLSTVSFAILDILNKKFVIKESTLSMLFFSALATTVLAFFPTLYVWKMPTVKEILLLFILGGGANLILLFILKAFACIDASAVAPFRYFELILSSMVGYFIFSEIPSSNIYIGALLIVPSTFFIIFYETRKKA
jgi:S-adenosylmethionine uptake transporter